MKLNLNDLAIKSFVTTFTDQKSSTARGGGSWASDCADCGPPTMDDNPGSQRTCLCSNTGGCGEACQTGTF